TEAVDQRPRAGRLGADPGRRPAQRGRSRSRAPHPRVPRPRRCRCGRGAQGGPPVRDRYSSRARGSPRVGHRPCAGEGGPAVTTGVVCVVGLQRGDTATVRWRDGLTQITGRVVSVKRMTTLPWLALFSGMPSEVRVAEGSWWLVRFSGMPSEVRVAEGSWSFVSGESPT